MGTPFVERPCRLALEVDDPVAVGCEQDLAQVVVAVDPGQHGRAGQRLEVRQLVGDRRRQLAQGAADVVRGDGQGPLELGRRIGRPGTSFGRGRVARLELGRAIGGGQCRVHGRRERSDVGRDLGRELDRDLPRREDPRRERLRHRLVEIRPVDHVRLSDCRGGGAVACRDDLRESRQRRDGREPRLLGQVGGQLEVRVQTGLEPSIRLEHDLLTEHDRCVRLIGPEVALGVDRDPRWHRRPRSADEGCCGRLGVGGRDPCDRASVGHRTGQGPPRAIARSGWAKRSPGQGEGISTRYTAGQARRHDGKHMRRDVVEDERLVEVDRLDRAALLAEPAFVGEGRRVKTRDGGLDVRQRHARPTQA
jgi:hypothetical protein